MAKSASAKTKAPAKAKGDLIDYILNYHRPVPQKFDKITLDIIENALRNARHEMDAVLFRSAMSPVIREQHDGFPMITTPDGRMVVGQFGAYITGFISHWQRGIKPDDVFLISDPYKCGGAISHLNDWLVLLPIFYKGELVSWASQFGHTIDMGGPVSGSLPTDATTIFGEGMRIPPVKLFDGGQLNEDLLDTILNNSRMPTMNYFDLMAIVAACRTAEKRVLELCERFGKDVLLDAYEALLDRTNKASNCACRKHPFHLRITLTTTGAATARTK